MCTTVTLLLALVAMTSAQNLALLSTLPQCAVSPRHLSSVLPSTSFPPSKQNPLSKPTHSSPSPAAKTRRILPLEHQLRPNRRRLHLQSRPLPQIPTVRNRRRLLPERPASNPRLRPEILRLSGRQH